MKEQRGSAVLKPCPISKAIFALDSAGRFLNNGSLDHGEVELRKAMRWAKLGGEVDIAKRIHDMCFEVWLFEEMPKGFNPWYGDIRLELLRLKREPVQGAA